MEAIEASPIERGLPLRTKVMLYMSRNNGLLIPKTTYSSMARRLRTAGVARAGRPGLLTAEEEIHVLEVVTGMMAGGGAVDTNVVSATATNVLRQNPLRRTDLVQFGGSLTFSCQWAANFCRRNNLSVRVPTSTQTHTAEQHAAAAQFLEEIAEITRENDIQPELLLNMDQTSLPVQPTQKKTRAIRGTQRVVISGNTNKKAITGQITTTCSGALLKTQLIYAGRQGLLRSVPVQRNPECVYAQTSSHWANEHTLALWAKESLLPYIQGVRSKPNMENAAVLVLLDTFPPHVSDSFRDMLGDLIPSPIFMKYIPAGCTDILQPNDQHVNMVLKRQLRNSYREWLTAEMFRHSAGGHPPSEFCTPTKWTTLKDKHHSWVADALAKVTPEVITASWRKALEGHNEEHPVNVDEAAVIDADEHDDEDDEMLIDLTEGGGQE